MYEKSHNLQENLLLQEAEKRRFIPFGCVKAKAELHDIYTRLCENVLEK